MTGRIAYVLAEISCGLICLVWVWYCGLHWLVTGRSIVFDERFAIVRFLGARAERR